MAVLTFPTLEALEGWAKLVRNFEQRYALGTNIGTPAPTDEPGKTRYFVLLRPTVSSGLDTLVAELSVTPKELETLQNTSFFETFRKLGRYFPLSSFLFRED